jgi:hypothetical protein
VKEEKKREKEGESWRGEGLYVQRKVRRQGAPSWQSQTNENGRSDGPPGVISSQPIETARNQLQRLNKLMSDKANAVEILR